MIQNYQKLYRIFLLYLIFLSGITGIDQLFSQEVAVLKYEGGGDWYANPTAVPNLISFSNKQINTRIDSKPKTVSADSQEIFDYPIVFMTGHGNITLNEQSAGNLRKYLISGGFLHISDNYGLDIYIRREMKKVFPELDFLEVPYDHPIYHQNFSFDKLPKIHEHDNKPAQGFGIFYEGRMVCFYDYQCDLSDGWEDEAVHHDPYEIRLKALQMGANIIAYAFKN